jgi:hypothetical protein
VPFGSVVDEGILSGFDLDRERLEMEEERFR